MRQRPITPPPTVPLGLEQPSLLGRLLPRRDGHAARMDPGSVRPVSTGRRVMPGPDVGIGCHEASVAELVQDAG